MTDREVMRQALLALEGWDNYGKWAWPDTALEQSKRNTTESLASLRAALEQQAEPVHGDIRALKYRIHELEGEVIGYKRMLDVAEAPPQRKPFDILAITTAYEQGVGKGHQAQGRSVEIDNPYAPGECQQAWALGYDEGKKQAASKAAHGIGEKP